LAPFQTAQFWKQQCSFLRQMSTDRNNNAQKSEETSEEEEEIEEIEDYMEMPLTEDEMDDQIDTFIKNMEISEEEMGQFGISRDDMKEELKKASSAKAKKKEEPTTKKIPKSLQKLHFLKENEVEVDWGTEEGEEEEKEEEKEEEPITLNPKIKKALKEEKKMLSQPTEFEKEVMREAHEEAERIRKEEGDEVLDQDIDLDSKTSAEPLRKKTEAQKTRHEKEQEEEERRQKRREEDVDLYKLADRYEAFYEKLFKEDKIEEVKHFHDLAFHYKTNGYADTLMYNMILHDLYERGEIDELEQVIHEMRSQNMTFDGVTDFYANLTEEQKRAAREPNISIQEEVEKERERKEKEKK